MAIFVRPADIVDESESLPAFLTRYLSNEATLSRYEWLYLGNPDGRALAWVAEDADCRQTIGIAAAFPRKFVANGKVITGYILGDFCIHSDFRSLGPAVALQRKCLSDLAKMDATIVLDFPSAAMLSVYKRLGIDSFLQMPRYAKPLRVDNFVGRRVRPKSISGGISAFGNLLLRIRDMRLPHAPGVEINEESTDCGPEFVESLPRWQEQELAVARTREFLNWRFMGHPQRKYQLSTAHKNGRLVGYLICHSDVAHSTVADFRGDDSQICAALLSKVILNAQAAGVDTISVPLLGAGHQKSALERRGFRPREAAPVVLLKRIDQSAGFQSDNLTSLHLTHGDRES
jgi:hypothetical protein